MNDIEKARELLAVAEAACVKVLGPNVAVVTEHIYKALTIAEGNLVAVDTPTETDEEHAERAKAAIEAMQAEVKAGEERQAKAQAAYNAIVAKGGENADIYANKVYAEMLAAPIDGEESIHDFTDDQILEAVVAEQEKTAAERDEAEKAVFDNNFALAKANKEAEEAENAEGESDEPKADEGAEGDSDEPKADEGTEVVETAKPGKKK